MEKYRDELDARKSKYQGVSRAANSNQWYARLSRGGNLGRTLYLGTFDSEEDAGKAYDLANIRINGPNAFTNFGIRNYNVLNILSSEMLPIGKGASRTIRTKNIYQILSRYGSHLKGSETPEHEPQPFQSGHVRNGNEVERQSFGIDALLRQIEMNKYSFTATDVIGWMAKNPDTYLVDASVIYDAMKGMGMGMGMEEATSN